MLYGSAGSLKVCLQPVFMSEKSMVNILTSRINVLRKATFSASFQVRTIIAEGIVISVIL
jgi:hypothetical protein